MYLVILLGHSSSLRDIRAETMENVAYSFILWPVLLALSHHAGTPAWGTVYPTTSVNNQVGATEAHLLASPI